MEGAQKRMRKSLSYAMEAFITSLSEGVLVFPNVGGHIMNSISTGYCPFVHENPVQYVSFEIL